MHGWPSPAPLTATSLRRELNARALHRATRLGLRHELTTGHPPSVIFGVGEEREHGNFHPSSYHAILQRPEWRRRLDKAHTGSRKAMPRADWQWRELDCASSSDALLMNVFCHPEVFGDHRAAALLGTGSTPGIRFGVKLGVPLANRVAEMTEVDMQLDTPSGSLLVEAKLTESNFQTARQSLVLRFRDLEEVFDIDRLPRTRTSVAGGEWDEERAAIVPVERGRTGAFASYQLIRSTLAAHAMGCAFCVLLDGRRADLVEAWHRVLQAVLNVELRCRLQMLTWQELASVLPPELQYWLAEKYGILGTPVGL